MVNLKGGVGKTTLTANLGACLALDDSRPLRVLLVDLDFQGTLTSQCASLDLVNIQLPNENTSAKLLSAGGGFDLLRQLAIPVNGVTRARVIVAEDKLEREDYYAQARFLLLPNEDVRFRYRRIFHDPRVADHYDLILFDCPPRLTASSINALACSDHVVIPTKLTEESVRAVPRLVAWLRRMQGIVSADVLGVIANNVNDYVAEQKGHRQLIDELRRFNLADRIFRTGVKTAASALPPGQGRVAALTAHGRRLFSPVAAELRSRLGI